MTLGDGADARPGPRGLLLDLDGTVYEGEALVPDMVGDDLEADVGGAQAPGARGYLVQTGKYRTEEVEASGAVPDQMIPSVAALPALLLVPDRHSPGG